MISKPRLALFTCLLLFYSVYANASSKFANSHDSNFVGHNLTQSTYTGSKGKWLAGNYVVGFSPTESTLIATSPWVLGAYNTHNIHLKWAQEGSNGSRWAVMGSYFESIRSKDFMSTEKAMVKVAATNETVEQSYFRVNRYQWRSYSTHLLNSYLLGPRQEIFTSLKWSYYLNDDFAYSLRMDPGANDIRDQWDVSVMLKTTDIDDPETFYIFEVGTVGLNYKAPFAHIGASILFVDGDWSMQLGGSFTAQMNELLSKRGYEIGRLDSRPHISSETGEKYTYRYYQSALHPEIQFQYQF